MRKTVALFAVVGALAFDPSLARAQNLLTNPSLDAPAVHEGTTATGWTLETFRTNSGPALTGNFADFANHTAPPTVPPGRGLWMRAFVGTDADRAQANLFQDVPGTPGRIYRMSGWAHFEGFFPGGVSNLNAGTGPPDPTNDGPASPTDTFFSLQFLGAGDVVLPGGASIELRANGQTNDPDTAMRDWLQHSLTATAPAGTVEVRVRASLVDGLANPGVNPQSAFVDDFSLTIIPEPASIALCMIALVGSFGLIRRR